MQTIQDYLESIINRTDVKTTGMNVANRAIAYDTALFNIRQTARAALQQMATNDPWEQWKAAARDAYIRINGDPLPSTPSDNPIRYARIESDDPQREAKRKAQLDQFEIDAKAGKVLCLSDLMINAGM